MSDPTQTQAVEALATELHQAFHRAWNPSISLNLYSDSPIWREQARTILASDWVAEHRAVQRRASAKEVVDLGRLTLEFKRQADRAEAELVRLREAVEGLAAEFDTAVGFRGAATALRNVLAQSGERA